MPILVLTAEASYHAPDDHCTVKYLAQAGAKPTHIRLADLGIKGNSHVRDAGKEQQGDRRRHRAVDREGGQGNSVAGVSPDDTLKCRPDHQPTA
jgi:hypothetical protein